MPMEQQMEMFAHGGLDDDGMSRDPVSGNEIPPGSMANEVRDDVDAKLSDGEYVVPANVVRFFGVKFFEDLRTQAMDGLGAMEQNGRIGGESVPSGMPMQDQMAGAMPDVVDDSEMQMLQGIMNKGGYISGYANGGDASTEYTSTAYNPSQYPILQYANPGSSVFNPNLNWNVQQLENPYPTNPVAGPVLGPSEWITYTNKAGNQRAIEFRDGQPVNPGELQAALDAGFYAPGSPEIAPKDDRNDKNDPNFYNQATGESLQPVGVAYQSMGQLARTVARSGGSLLSTLVGATGVGKLASSTLGKKAAADLQKAVDLGAEGFKMEIQWTNGNGKYVKVENSAADKAAAIVLQEAMKIVDSDKRKKFVADSGLWTEANLASALGSKDPDKTTATLIPLDAIGLAKWHKSKGGGSTVSGDGVTNTKIPDPDSIKPIPYKDYSKEEGAKTYTTPSLVEMRSTQVAQKQQAIEEARDRARAYAEDDEEGKQAVRDNAAAANARRASEASKQQTQANRGAGTTSRPVDNASVYSGSVQGKAFAMNKGGLIKKPTKKKNKK